MSRLFRQVVVIVCVLTNWWDNCITRDARHLSNCANSLNAHALYKICVQTGTIVLLEMLSWHLWHDASRSRFWVSGFAYVSRLVGSGNLAAYIIGPAGLHFWPLYDYSCMQHNLPRDVTCVCPWVCMLLFTSTTSSSLGSRSMVARTRSIEAYGTV